MAIFTIWKKNNTQVERCCRTMASYLTNIRLLHCFFSYSDPLSQSAKCQINLLDSTFTFRAGIIRTGNALNIISKATGYNFTYDSRIIDTERKTNMSFSNIKLSLILDSIFHNDSLVYSVIDKYIIISSKVSTVIKPIRLNT